MAPLPSEEQKVFEHLRSKHAQLITVESCTGGQVADRLTNLPGSSENYFGGFVAYDNLAKQGFVGLDKELLLKHGAVSEPVAQAMAEGALKILMREKSGSPLYLAIATTGIAGPGGGTDNKPVGLCFVSVATSAGQTRIKRVQAPENSNRLENKKFFADEALKLADSLLS